MLDFFSLARGYSISLAGMMASIYFLYQFHKKEFNTTSSTLSVFWSIIAILGNLTVLNYSIAVYVIILLLTVWNKYQTEKNIGQLLLKVSKNLIAPTLLLFVCLYFILPISFQLRAAGALFMGGENGLWKDTLGTIVPRLLYGCDLSYWLIRGAKALFFLVLLSSIILVGLSHAKKQINTNSLFLGSLLLVFLIIVISTVVQHYLLGTLYLIERAVLFLFVIFNLITVFLVIAGAKKNSSFNYFLYLFAFIVLLHFLYSFNLKYVYEWKDECETKEMMEDLDKIRKPPPDKFNLTIGLPLALESSVNFYRITQKATWLNQSVRTKEINYLNDYFFLRPQDIHSYDSLYIIKKYPLTGNIMAKAKYPFPKKLVLLDTLADYRQNNSSFVIDSALIYSPGITIKIDEKLIKENCFLSCKLKGKIKDKPRADLFFIFSIENKNGSYFWINQRINDFLNDNIIENYCTFSTILPKNIQVNDKLKVYIWNPNKQSYLLEEMHLKWIYYSY